LSDIAAMKTFNEALDEASRESMMAKGEAAKLGAR
jgi:hypothetical protein